MSSTTNHNHCGQITAEVAILGIVILAAVLALRAYGQRAMQGYTFDSSQSLSTPFDPRAGLPSDPLRDNFSDRSSSSTRETTIQQAGHPMIGARHLEPEPHFGGPRNNEDWEDAIVLESLPTGPVPREPAAWVGLRTDASWSSSQSSSANVTYDNN